MAKLIIHQKLMKHPWPIIIGLMLFSLLLFVAGPDVMNAEDEGEFIGFVASIILGLGTFLLAMNIKSHIELHPTEIRFKDMPLSKKLKVIRLEEMESYSIEKYSLPNFKGLGFKRDFKGNKYIVMRFGMVLQIKTKQGKKLVLGINEPGKVKRYIEQNWEENPTYNG
tara:strand:- start:1761 stop:2261 length:501 start_codon:yes stop_codon:yes gene_type:complete